MSDDFCLTHGYEFMVAQFGNPVSHCTRCEEERQMFKLEMSDEDIGDLQSAVENMRSAPDGDEQRQRILEARWRLAFKLEALAKRADEARRRAE